MMKQFTGVILLASVLTGCATTGGGAKVQTKDAEIERTSKLARDAYDRGSIETASDLYLAALNKSRVVGDPVYIGNNAYNYAACLTILGQLADADSILEEARMEFRRVGAQVTDVLLLEAKVARLKGDNEKAQALVGALIVELGSRADRDELAQIHLLKADIECDRSRSAIAQKELDEAIVLADGLNLPTLGAEIARIRGRIKLIDNEPAAAAMAFDEETSQLQISGKYREMALAAGRAGMAYQDANKSSMAADRFFVAARSLFAQGDVIAALRMIEPAVNAAEKADNIETLQQTMKLFQQIKKSVQEMGQELDAVGIEG